MISTIHATVDRRLNLNIAAVSALYEHICHFPGDLQKMNQHSFKSCTAIGCTSEFKGNTSDPFNGLQEFIHKKPYFIAAAISYELRRSIEKLKGRVDPLEFPALHLFVPKFLIERNADAVTISFDTNHADRMEAEKILNAAFSGISCEPAAEQIAVTPRLSRAEYIDKINLLKGHIQNGQIYEVNFCMDFFAEDCSISPERLFHRLYEKSRAPFSCYWQADGKHLLSASPERFLQKVGNRLMSQPIKGTAARNHQDKLQDAQNKAALSESQKERAENVMIVDLVRNDLSKIAAKGSVRVDELCGIYSFSHVHQMISTISCELREGTTFSDILRATFPMGSMTGAPKVRAMQLIEEYEGTARGLYSGAVGYITADGSFDFNVVIRSILYNEKSGYLSYSAGSAITSASDAEMEYEEIIQKIAAMKQALEIQ